jgi:UDP-N-acetylglucosamine diphosphorylase / glucose-1-phosphate thymidylyltransferase / UDP-N-acetylgalactosamine diphosphorylase / glucosamine-1-phosphate N-acetyltransferase / galactosamine-1-phosphate N-acetyltransferase
MKLCVFEDVAVANLGPLALTRPAFDLRCGATSLQRKQRRFFGSGETAALVRPELEALSRLAHPGLRVNDPSWPGGEPKALVALVNARWLAPAAAFDHPGRAEVGLVGEEVAWVVLPALAVQDLERDKLAELLESWREQLPERAAGGAMLAFPWDLIAHNAAALEQDFRHAGPTTLPPGRTLVGLADRLYIDPEARVEPMAMIDTTNGPVTIERGAVVQAFSRIEGPCYVGPDTHLLAARVQGSSIGPQCRIGGEVEASIIHGHSNKAHDGFLGHSYLGEWVNFGAGTHASDERIDGGTVRCSVNDRSVDSGRAKVGSFVGDHTKTSLDVLLNPGSLVGPFGLLLASGAQVPWVVPPFCQVARGRIQERTDLWGMFATAKAVLGRRNREWTAEHAELFFRLFEATAGQRRQASRESEQRLQQAL